MSYNAQELFSEMGSRAGSKIPVAIHSNCNLSKVETGDNYIDFIYEKDGNFNNKRAWMPSPDPQKLYPKEGETPQQAFARSEKEYLAHIVKHLHIFLTDEEFNTFAASDIRTFTDKAAQLLNAKKDSCALNLKLIYDTDGVFPVFGKYPDYVEKYIDGQEPTLAYTKYEREKRLTPATAKTDDVVVNESANASDLY